MTAKTLFTLLIGACLGTSVTLILVKPTFLQSNSMDQSRNRLPDYSGINVRHAVINDITVGNGTKVKIGDRILLNYSVWLYDPARPGNKGELLYQSEQESYEALTLTQQNSLKYFSGMLKGGIRQVIIPQGEPVYGKQLFEMKAGAIHLVEGQFIDVL